MPLPSNSVLSLMPVLSAQCSVLSAQCSVLSPSSVLSAQCSVLSGLLHPQFPSGGFCDPLQVVHGEHANLLCLHRFHAKPILLDLILANRDFAVAVAQRLDDRRQFQLRVSSRATPLRSAGALNASTLASSTSLASETA